MRDSFVFYRSFLEAAALLPKEQKAQVLTAIIEYALNGTECESEDAVVRAFLMMAKPQIDKNNTRYENGRKGGRPKETKSEEIVTEIKPNNNQTETKTKPSENQKITEIKPNNNQTITKHKPNVNVNDNVNDIYITSLSREVCENSEVSEFTPVREPPPKREIDYRKIIETYHSICTDYPKIIKITEGRKQKMRIRFLEEMNGDYNTLETLFVKMQESKFMRGDNRQGWKATFDWLFDNSKNWVKVLEGNYDNRENIKATNQNNYERWE